MRSLIAAVYSVATLLSVSSSAFAQGAQPTAPPPPPPLEAPARWLYLRPEKRDCGQNRGDITRARRASVSGMVAVYALAWSEDRARMAAAAGAAGSRDPSRLIFAEQLLLLSGGRVRLQFARAADAGLADAQVALGELY